MLKIVLPALMLFLTSWLNITGQNLEEFKALLDDCGMVVSIPEGMVECNIVTNDDMEYEYAVKYPDKNFELRYAIRPIRYKEYANEDIKQEFENIAPFRNSSYAIILQTVILNITGGNDFPVQVFETKAVNNEFNADWGATTFIQLNSDFGKGYKYCLIVAIHKKDVADAYYFYLSDTTDHFSKNMQPLFHTLKFE